MKGVKSAETLESRRKAAAGGGPEAGSTRLARRRNARGQGARLAEDIVAGAMAIIERTDSDEAVTLRSVAREVGITAPSIYAHFADRDAVLWAVAATVFDQISDAVRAAITGIDDADVTGRLVAGCEAYVNYGLAHPEWYRALFAKRFPTGVTEPLPEQLGGPDRSHTPAALVDERFPKIGGEAFGLLVESIERCVAAGVSASADPFADATAVWVALHGLVSLWSTVCDFPWPEPDTFVERLVLPLAAVVPPKGG